ncbi:MAG TPA: aminotransferase class I/II-fold pyridoxal phosphate-dependent enzyme [Gemmataceae bacterium]|nr:aminotransferase class I/II-fold pyridoxal phosphate-dependent enzyme [Gemmataceae bacterium]
MPHALPPIDQSALLGGTPVRPQGPPEWPIADDDVLHALQAAYADRSWGKYHGAYVERLTGELIRYHGVEFALVCASGTFAVELALRALKIGPGDEVLLAAYDYPGNFLNVHAVGARPVLVDIHPDNWNLDPDLIEAAISPATRAIIASHLHGGAVPMREVMTLAAVHVLRVIEDAAQMPGAIIQGRKAGTWGDVGILSFGGSKLLTAGRGGALLTRNAEVCQRARVWMNRGNVICPLSELQAAVLLPQLPKLDARNAQRARSVQLSIVRLQALPGLRPFTTRLPDTQPGYYKLGFQYDAAAFGLSRERFLAAVRAEGIAVDEGFRALHVGRSPSRFRQGGVLTQAERAHAGCVVLHHPVLLGGVDEVEEVAKAILKVLANVERLRE